MTRLAGVAAGRGRGADLRATLARVASRARSASRSRSACLAFASWVVMVYMMFSFRSSPPRLAAIHTGDELAAAGWTTSGEISRGRPPAREAAAVSCAGCLRLGQPAICSAFRWSGGPCLRRCHLPSGRMAALARVSTRVEDQGAST